MADPSQQPPAPKQEELPRDARVVKQVLESMGATDYEPRVVNQLLDFTYGYVSSVLQDAEVYADRAGRPVGRVETDDVTQAIQQHAAHTFAAPPPQEVLLELAAKRNARKLPELKPRYGLRLPPEEECLVAPNYQLAFQPPQDTQ